MRNTMTTLVLSAIALIAVGCKTDARLEGGTATAAPGKSADTVQHASPKAIPGSYEDWCEEHQVPESMCTRCNPALIPAFKATGDWCQEHGVPESQCRACNPSLKTGRPLQKGGN